MKNIVLGFDCDIFIFSAHCKSLIFWGRNSDYVKLKLENWYIFCLLLINNFRGFYIDKINVNILDSSMISPHVCFHVS